MDREKTKILTVPNLLTLLRLLLIIPIVISIIKGNFLVAFLLTLLSGASDVLDGIIARKFGQVSSLGKVLDPIADKLTQCALIACLIRRYRAMIFMIVSFLLRESVVGFFSLYTMKKTKKARSARWFGKVNTVIIYGVMGMLLLFPTLPAPFAEGAIWFSSVLMQLSLICYVLYYIKILVEHQSKKSDE